MLKRRRGNKKLGRSHGARRALLKSLALNLFEHGAIITSPARAKASRHFIDRVLRTSQNSLVDVRKISATLGVNRFQSSKILRLASLIENGKSATRILKLSPRTGDASPRVKLELLVKAPSEVLKKTEKVKSLPKSVAR